jgi:hypothetical protein
MSHEREACARGKRQAARGKEEEEEEEIAKKKCNQESETAK